MMIKVLVWGMTENSGGVESVIMNYYRNIDRTKLQFDFLTNTPDIAFSQEILANGDKIIQIPTKKQNASNYYKTLDIVFKNGNYDAFWMNTCGLYNMSIMQMAKKHKVKVRIVHSHNSKNMGNFKDLLVHKLIKLFVDKYATDFWACSELAGKYFYKNKILKSDKYQLIYNAIDLEKFKFNPDTRSEYRKTLNLDDKFIIGHVGRFHFQKNQKFLINVFYELQKKVSNAVLLLVGQGEDEASLKQQIADLKLEDKVQFLGVRKDVDKLLQCMDLMIFPSLFEGLPVIMLESQASGLPIYASDTISTQTKINKNFKFLSLQLSAQDWANYIYNDLHNLDRDFDAIQNLKNSGFDIKEQVNEFTKLLCSREKNDKNR